MSLPDLSLQSLIQSKKQKEDRQSEARIIEKVRKFYDELATDQFQFEDALRVAETLRQAIASVGTNHLNKLYLNHMKK